jgi:hypothetical protein
MPLHASIHARRDLDKLPIRLVRKLFVINSTKRFVVIMNNGENLFTRNKILYHH